jgi:hypothetical protein
MLNRHERYRGMRPLAHFLVALTMASIAALIGSSNSAHASTMN